VCTTNQEEKVKYHSNTADKKNGLRVLSLFDGMSCGQQALERIGVNVLEYYASEIDKHAIKVTQHNYPNTIQLGDVTKVNGSDLPKIDLLLGGSPCQSFSFAGKRKGMSTKCETEILTLTHYLQLKSECYEFEGQSYLFWEYMRLLNEVKPKYFLLENVMMGEKWEKVLSKAIGVKPIEINSALVSAQNRRRLYWTNIGMQPMGLFGELASIIPQPKDKGILLKDILESDVPDKFYLSDKILKGFENHNIKSKDKGNGFEFKPKNDLEKSNCITARCYKMGVDDNYIVASRGRNPESPKSREAGLETEQMLEPRYDGKTNCLTSVQKDNLVMQLNPSTESGGKQPYQQNRVYDTNGISPALCANKADLLIKENTLIDFSHQNEGLRYYEGKAPTLTQRNYKEPHCIFKNSSIRRLTPTECERLQTVPDNATKSCLSINYLYICNETNVIKQWLQNAELQNAIQISQVKKPDYATNIIYDFLELEKLKEMLSIRQRNATTMDAIIFSKLLKDIALLTTKDLSNTEHLNCLKNLFREMKNVNIVIKPLAKTEVGREACVINITKIGLDTMTLYTQIINAVKLNQEGIMVELMVRTDTGLIWKIQSEETLNVAKLYTISTLIKQIIQSKTYFYSKIKMNIKSAISNLSILEQNYLSVELLDLRMENISLNSDTQRYKMLGNGWTIDVVAHILSYIDRGQNP